MARARKNFFVTSLTSFLTSAVLFVINYVFYHYTGDDRANGIDFMFTPYHAEVQKPFITDLIGQLATIMLAAAIISLFIALIFYRKSKQKAIEAVDTVETVETLETLDTLEGDAQ